MRSLATTKHTSFSDPATTCFWLGTARPWNLPEEAKTWTRQYRPKASGCESTPEALRTRYRELFGEESRFHNRAHLNLVGRGPASINAGGRVTNLGVPRMQQYTMSLESRLFGGWVGTASYIGSKMQQLWYVRQINRPPASLTPFTTSRFLYPGYSNMSYVEKGASAAYHALQTRVQHRYSNGLEFDALFQWVSEMTDLADNGFSTLGGTPEDPYCRRCELAPNFTTDNLDFRAILLYELPMGNGKKFAPHTSKIVNGFIGGQVSSVLDLRNGRPGAVTFSGSDPSNTNLRSGFAQIVPGCNVRSGDGRSAPYLNINCFKVPDAGTFGNARWGTFRQPGAWSVSGTLYKYFPLYGERVKLRLNAVFDNAFNHPTWPGVGSSLASPGAFGVLGQGGSQSSTSTARSVLFQGQVIW